MIARSHRLLLKLGVVQFEAEHAGTIDLSSHRTVKRAYGILGAETFNNYVVLVEYEKHTLSIFDPRRYGYHVTGAVVPMTVTGNLFSVPVRLTANGSTVVHLERLDTDSQETVADTFVRYSRVKRNSLLQTGHFSVQYDRLQIGPYLWEHGWAPYAPDRVVGTELLSRFRVTIDAPHKRLILEATDRLHAQIPTPQPLW